MTLKEQLHKIVEDLPDQQPHEALEEMHYRLYVLQKLKRGLSQLDAGQEISHEVIRERMKKWQSD